MAITHQETLFMQWLLKAGRNNGLRAECEKLGITLQEGQGTFEQLKADWIARLP